MYTYYIVNAGETAPDARVAQAIKNFKYENETVVCIARGGYVSEIQTVYVLRTILNDFTTEDVDELAQRYIDSKNADAEQEVTD